MQHEHRMQALIHKDPFSEELLVSHLPFKDLCKGRSDIRTLFQELKDFPTPIDPNDVVVDWDKPLHKSFHGLALNCPDEIVAQQQAVRVFYFGSDQKLHHGQVVVHSTLVADVLGAFNIILKERIVIESVIPVADPRFERDGRWDDNASMEANNSSAFNYRRVLTATGEQKRLSLHSLGMALDINPVQNPCYGDPEISRQEGYSKESGAGYRAFVPKNGRYDLSDSRSFHNRHPVVLFLQERGWTWGGEWADPKDLHHFQKIPKGLEERVSELRAASKL